VKGPEIGMQQWMEHFRQATQEVAGHALKFDASAKPARKDAGSKAKGGTNASGEDARPGGYISILSESASLRLGLTAAPEGCQMLARSLLGLHPTQPLADKEVEDAVSELMNIIAGRVKSRVSESDPSLQLGLPMFIQGRIQETGSMERQAAETMVGPVACRLLVYRIKRGG